MKSILIIENNLDLLSKYADILKKSGYDVLLAPQSDIGITLALNKVPALILSNTTLADINGFELLSILALNPSTSKIPFMFINPSSTQEEVKKGMENGAEDFITNPFHCNQLLRAVEGRLYKNPNKSWELLPLTEDKVGFDMNSIGIEKFKELIAHSKTRHIKKKQTLYYEGDHSQWLYLLVEGSIKTLNLTRDGREFITGLYKPKSFIGLDNLLLQDPYNESAEATENSMLYFISKNSILNLLNEHIDLNQYFIKILSNYVREKEELLIELAFESVRKRLAKVLVRLAKDTVPIDYIDISRDELAGLAGVATETVSRILSDFKERRIIERNGSVIQITDLDGLINMKN